MARQPIILVNGGGKEHALVVTDLRTTGHKVLRDPPYPHRTDDTLTGHMHGADIFVFLPGGADLLLLVSLLVAFKLDDPAVRGKRIVLFNPEGEFNELLEWINYLKNQSGIVNQLGNAPSYEPLTVASTPEELLKNVQAASEISDCPETHQLDNADTFTIYNEAATDPLNPLALAPYVAVFCSASTTVPDQLKKAHCVGETLAKAGFNLVFGAGSASMMGEVSSAALHNGAFVIGVTTSVVADHEPPDDKHNSATILVIDIYRRQAIMTGAIRFIPNLCGFIILEGGFGTAQEVFAAIAQNILHPEDIKPIIFVGKEFHEPLLNIIEKLFNGMKTGVTVVDTVEEAIAILRERAQNMEPDIPDSFVSCEIPPGFARAHPVREPSGASLFM